MCAKKAVGEQVAALPYRLNGKQIEFALVTSRTTKRWIVPKGWKETGTPPHKMAAVEALEEAGLEGRLTKQPVGVFFYDKILDDGSALKSRVEVFALEVRKQRSKFKEADERNVKWFSPQEAADRVDEDDLAMLILHFASTLSKAA